MEKKVKIPEQYKYICAFLTMRCNLNCSFCLNSLDNNKKFNRDKIKLVKAPIRPIGVVIKKCLTKI